MQADERWQEFSQRMAYEGSLHIGVETFAPVPESLARHTERNIHVLRALASLDERRVEGSDDDSPLIQELQRMDSKINVLLDIVDRLLVPVSMLPPRHSVRFNAVGVRLPASLLPAADSLLVRLHFDACRALPLELPARMDRLLNDGDAFVYFCEIGEMVEDGLERFVFCHHRRKVAEARLTGATENVLGSRHRV
jgi:atypical PilZ domain-containing cyclic di-GMP receptor